MVLAGHPLTTLEREVKRLLIREQLEKEQLRIVQENGYSSKEVLPCLDFINNFPLNHILSATIYEFWVQTKSITHRIIYFIDISDKKMCCFKSWH